MKIETVSKLRLSISIMRLIGAICALLGAVMFLYAVITSDLPKPFLYPVLWIGVGFLIERLGRAINKELKKAANKE